MGSPPSELGTVNDTVALWWPATAVAWVGAPGLPGFCTMVIVVVGLVMVPFTGAERLKVNVPPAGSPSLKV